MHFYSSIDKYALAFLPAFGAELGLGRHGLTTVGAVNGRLWLTLLLPKEPSAAANPGNKNQYEQKCPKTEPPLFRQNGLHLPGWIRPLHGTVVNLLAIAGYDFSARQGKGVAVGI